MTLGALSDLSCDAGELMVAAFCGDFCLVIVCVYVVLAGMEKLDCFELQKWKVEIVRSFNVLPRREGSGSMI